MDDQREHIEFFGFYTNDWFINFGTFAIHRQILDTGYISDACDTLDSSEASITHEFLYPHHIKKTYYIEGIIEGHITIAASGCTSTCTSYKVSVFKMHEDNTPTELATTGWITVNDTLAWDAALSAGDEAVYHFWMETLEEQKLTDKERIYLKVEVNCDSCTHLMHSNDSEWEDVWIDIPFRM